jgi:hypothetical protein
MGRAKVKVGSLFLIKIFREWAKDALPIRDQEEGGGCAGTVFRREV